MTAGVVGIEVSLAVCFRIGQWASLSSLFSIRGLSEGLEDLISRAIFFLRRGQTINQTTVAVSREKPNEMSRVPHQGILSNPSTEWPGAMDRIRHTHKGK